MKHLKMLGLAAIAALGLLAFVGAGTASATELCKKHESPCAAANKYGVGTKIHAVNELGHITLKAAFAEARCSSTVEGEVTNAGSATTTVSGKITSLSFTNCTEPCIATQEPTKNADGSFGTLELHTAGASFNTNGTVTGFNAAVTVTCSGVKCEFGTNPSGTDLGTITGSSSDTTKATMDINTSVTYIRGDGQFVCAGFGDTAAWIGNYEVTSPVPLYIV